jgi:Arc/MetJ-type ribon-helix-helix transcriptional regulator
MTVLKARTRMISVRVSEEEYSAFRRLCLVAGARSVSDLTRDAMRMLLNSTNREDVLGIHVNEFRAQMRSLDRNIEQLAAEIANRFEAQSAKD